MSQSKLAARPFGGSITALVTPFAGQDADSVDFDAFDVLIERQIAARTSALVPCGTTGESPVLTHDEHGRIVQRCVRAVKGRVPVIAGTGSNSTREAIALSRQAADCGADALLIVAPYYNKPTQEGLYAHFKAIHDATALPIILYNIPGRCVVDITPDTCARLADLPRIAGLKDATNDLTRPTTLRARIAKPFALLSGEDATASAFLAMGGHGCISVTSNVAPDLCAQMHESWRAGDLSTFSTLRDRLAPLHRALFLETSPAPVKYALSRLGLCAETLRLPLVSPGPATRRAVDEALESAGIFGKAPLPAREMKG
ncbi:MAG: 4-hydroxy-tetrahydrodipicolinate synthase [Rhodospirillales bacterium]|nr:4-hydroxy-tetrahydrodipicolinate synthase [Rhodospirillales bacterium]